jgi:hypothetical protein
MHIGFLWINLKEARPLGRPRHRVEDIRVDLKTHKSWTGLI